MHNKKIILIALELWSILIAIYKKHPDIEKEFFLNNEKLKVIAEQLNKKLI